MSSQSTTASSPTTVKGILPLILAAFLWGFAPVLTKDVLDYVPPLIVLVIQFVTSMLLLWLAVLVQRLPLPALNRATLNLALTGLLVPGVTSTLLIFGLTLTTASNATILVAVEPIIILFLARLFLKESMTLSTLLLALLGCIGVVLVTGASTPMKSDTSVFGNVLLLAASMCLGVYVVLMRQHVEHVPPVLLIALQQTVGLIWALMLWLASLALSATSEFASISPRVWSTAALSGIFEYALAFWCYLLGLRYVPASVAGVFLNLTPVFGVISAVVLLNEQLSSRQWIGALLILSAVLSMSRQAPQTE